MTKDKMFNFELHELIFKEPLIKVMSPSQLTSIISVPGGTSSKLQCLE